jgi:branched-chain amino acid aminotransferase
MTDALQWASIDGQIMDVAEAVIAVTDEGLIRGDGVFDVVRLYDGRPFALEDHLARLGRSAANLRLPVDLEAVRADAYRLLAHAGPAAHRDGLRIMLTRGGRRLLMTEQFPPHPPRPRLASITYSPTLVLDGVKSLSYAANMLAGRIARERGFDEALLVTPEGYVLEAPTASIFWVQDEQIYTPPISEHILASITRAAVIELCDVQERRCTLAQLKAADDAFIASTAVEVQPVGAVDERTFEPGARLSTEAARAVRAHIAAEIQRTSAEIQRT